MVSKVDNSLAAGTWYVTNGFNPDYDCFACQLLSFEFNKPGETSPIFYNALYNLIAVNGTLIWNDIIMRGSETSPGILTLNGRDSGFSNVQHWYIMHLSDDTMLVYYCGDLMTWHFEGVLVMSKTPTLNQTKVPELTIALNSLDLGWDDLCELKPSEECANAPSPFQPYQAKFLNN